MKAFSYTSHYNAKFRNIKLKGTQSLTCLTSTVSYPSLDILLCPNPPHQPTTPTSHPPPPTYPPSLCHPPTHRATFPFRSNIYPSHPHPHPPPPPPPSQLVSTSRAHSPPVPVRLEKKEDRAIDIRTQIARKEERSVSVTVSIGANPHVWESNFVTRCTPAVNSVLFSHPPSHHSANSAN